ncbi:MAG: RNase adapter RapZ [Betaproteobacteria bacterium]|nr:RNase adapter RapZ [Betaproteobacteria bacterium]MDE2621777.1 RNase adapter RapZ [Betaproteobacteria bacterium]
MSDPARIAQVILITGLSGSGKSVALRALEDAGYFSMDNLPLPFVTAVIHGLVERGEHRIAVTLDARSGEAIQQLPETLASLQKSGLDVRLLFLDANDQDLVRRFSETRRPHPLAEGRRSIAECIGVERALLEGAANIARRIDTTQLSPNTLRAWVRDFVELDSSQLTLFFESFGFKHGIPLDADFVFDVRCIPNPFYDPKLRPLTGKDPEIARFLESIPATHRMTEDIQAFVRRWAPEFMRDNRTALTIALGCTGGQHRSVYLAEALACALRSEYAVRVIHRELAQ